MYSLDKRYKRRKPWLKRVILAVGGLVLLLVIATLAIWFYYDSNLKPLQANATAQTVVIASGSSPREIANQLHNAHLIRSAWAFEAYVRHAGAQEDLQAGSYSLSASQSVQDIVSQLSHGKVTTKLVTILPGQRIDQVRQALINDGFSEGDVDAALQPAQYEGNAALVDKPVGNSLEGYLYPDSFQRTGTTTASQIIQESINEMQSHLTPDIRAAFAKEGLSTYQGIILASIVEKEVSNTGDKAQVAQVFLKRLSIGMPLQSDATTTYGAVLAGQKPTATFPSVYNTYQNAGLPPTPVSNVSDSSLQAVAHPSNTDWLYFVAGDDGVTHFSHTIEEHQQLTQQYCHKLCQ